MPTPYRAFAPFQTLTDTPGRYLLHTGRGPIELTPTAPGVLRVRTGRRRRLPAYSSHAVSAPADAPESRLEPSASGARLSFDGLTLDLTFEPLRLRLLWPNGEAVAAEIEVGERGSTLTGRAALDPAAAIYGLGEKTGWLDKRHRAYGMRNTDVLLDRPEGIGLATDPLYASLPVFAVHTLAGTYGIYLDQTEFTTFDFTGDAYEFATPSPTCTFYVLAGPTLPEVVRQYTGLTGRAPLPPLWALGYHQCRWGYRSEADFRAIAHELRSRRLPADALWFDIDYMDGYRVFTWNKRFPRPAHLIADLKKEGFQSVTIVDPGVKVDPDYSIYTEGQAGGFFLHHPDGREFNLNVWPGLSALPDFHQPAARAWWGQHVADWQAQTGVAGIWNDMNEPAGTDVSGPIGEVLHASGDLPHPAARNAYGLYMARATYAGLLARDPNARPFILTRAAFSGAQAVTALWGGDNSPLWEHLSGSLPLLMNLGLSGMSFVGVDIGGFAGDVTAELLARWFQAGVFYPFCRNHAMVGTNAHEPWAFGPEVEAIARRALELRYQLLPYFYNLFYENSQTGAPLLRPLVWHYPSDPVTFNLGDQFLLGRDLLVAPVMAPGQTARAVYLPEGRWYAWNTGQVLEGPAHIVAAAPLDTLPLYVRAGAIIPMWPVAQHTGAIQRDQLRLHFWPGTGQADYYEDDGATQAHTRGDYRLTRFTWKAAGAGATLKWGRSEGDYNNGRETWTFVFHALPGMKAELDGKPARSQRETNVLLVTVPDDGQAHTLRLVHRAR